MKVDPMPAGFDWLTELEALSEGKQISPNRVSELKHMAGNWPTCACGQLCQLLDREADGSPVDERLSTWGILFLTAVQERKWCVALKIFKRIECRTAKLLHLEISEDVCPTQSVSGRV